MIFDTHAHYDDEAFNEDRDAVISGLKASGVERFADVGANLAGSRRAIEIAAQYDNAYAAIGVHPDDVGELEREGIRALRKIYDEDTSGKIVAVGEIGLDYHWKVETPEIQEKWFREQILISEELSLPIIIHSREAAMDTMRIVKDMMPHISGGVMHCYSYSTEQALEYIDMGFYLGIGGVVTYKNGKKLKEVVKAVPLEKLVLETDCPYLSPTPHRGERNYSGYLPLVVEAIAELKETDPETVMRQTWENACEMFRI